MCIYRYIHLTFKSTYFFKKEKTNLTKLMYTFGCPRAPPPKEQKKTLVLLTITTYFGKITLHFWG